MAFTVSCTACGSRFLLGDDLFRRKVSGNIVTVKCRNCEAEISVDARDVDTLPSHGPPLRRAPSPPRRKDKMGLVPPKPVSADEATSIWESEQTVSIAGKPAPDCDEPEFVDFEEIPASSSDAPPLNTLTHESARVHPPRRMKPPDDFLVNLGAGVGGILGAPTIDVSALTSAPTSVIEEFEIEPELSTQRNGSAPLAPSGGATIQLFDMSAVLPEATASATLGSSSSAPMQIDIDVGSTPSSSAVPSGKARQRKHVVAPQDAPPERTAKRGGALVWFGAVAVAAGVLVAAGLRGRRAPQAVTPEPAAQHSAALLSNAAPAIDPAPPIAEARSAAQSAPAEPSAAPKAAPNRTEKLASPQPAKAEPALLATEKAAPAEPAEPAEPAAPAVVEVRPSAAAAGTEFDRSAAVNALKTAAAQASSCRKDGDPSGTASLTIIFAPSGRVTSAQIQGPPFAGTPTGGCIANTMRHALIPAFDGDRVTVTKTVVIE